MASKSFSEEDLSCPVCCDIFINPVLLTCSHSVCSSCIQKVWENKTLKECPVCRTTSSNDRPPVNLALKNLCESFQQERREKSGSGVCRDHNEKLKLFCLDDQQPVCVVCRDSRKHTNHRFCPLDEAVADNKEILKTSLERLQNELKTVVNREQNLCKTAEEIKSHAQSTEKQIKDEFEELHQFLHDEEAARITALREEEEKRSQRMKKKIAETSKQISSLTITIRDIEEQMKAEDASFLQNFKATLQRAQFSLQASGFSSRETKQIIPLTITCARKQNFEGFFQSAQYLLDPDLGPSVAITFTDHLTNLKLSVLQKMKYNVGKGGWDSRKMNRRDFQRPAKTEDEVCS